SPEESSPPRRVMPSLFPTRYPQSRRAGWPGGAVGGCGMGPRRMATTGARRNFLSRLLPDSKGGQFFDLFEQHAERTREAAALLEKAVEELVGAVRVLRDLKDRARLIAHCTELNRLENEGARILRRAVARLFQESVDPIHVIKWKEIYDNLEDAIDRCEDVANVIEGVALEYSCSLALRSDARPRPPDPRRPGLRLHERLPRRGELDRHDRVDARADAAGGRRVGGLLQLRRRLRLRSGGGDDHREGRREPRGDRPAADLRRSRRRLHVGLDHLAL